MTGLASLQPLDKQVAARSRTLHRSVAIWKRTRYGGRFTHSKTSARPLCGVLFDCNRATIRPQVLQMQ